MNARDLALLDLLSRGYLAPKSNHPDHEALMAEWAQQYRARLKVAEQLLAAVAAIAAEEGTAMSTLAVTCRRCRIEFEPDPEAFPRGTWHTCPGCRGHPAQRASRVTEDDARRCQSHTARKNERQEPPCAV